MLDIFIRQIVWKINTLIINIEKKNIGVHRIRLTVGDARGPALTDKRKTLHDYSNID